MFNIFSNLRILHLLHALVVIDEGDDGEVVNVPVVRQGQGLVLNVFPHFREC